jgi:ADP-glucose pyrophosphorylase
VLERAHVGRDVYLEDVIVGEGASIEAGEQVEPGAVVAPVDGVSPG